MTHDLICSILDALGANIKFILLSDLKGDTFYAKLVLNANDRQIEVDARPSDALALAVRAVVSIYAEEAVLNKSGIMLDQETGSPMAQGKKPEGATGVSEDESRRMSAFRDFINKLDLDDLDKRQS